MLLHACGHLAIFSRDNVRSNAFILLNLHVITTREISGYLQIYASFCTLLTRTLHDLSTSFQFNRLEAQGWSWQRILAGYAIPFEVRDIRGEANRAPHGQKGYDSVLALVCVLVAGAGP